MKYFKNWKPKQTKEERKEQNKCRQRINRYKKLPDNLKMSVSDSEFFTSEDKIYINNI